MSGYNDRRLYDNCYDKETTLGQVKQSNYSFYQGYAINENCCNGFPSQGSTKNLFNQDLNKFGDRSEIESLLQWRNVNEFQKNSNCSEGRTLEEKNKLLNKKLVNFEYNCDSCNPEFEQINTKLDGTYNRGILYSRLEENNLSNYNQNKIYNGFEGTEQNNNNRFGINTKLMSKDLYNKMNKK